MYFPDRKPIVEEKKAKKLKYQYDNSLDRRFGTGNYYWSDGMSSTFMACARKAGIKDARAYGSDFSRFWDKYYRDYFYKNYAHPTEMRKIIHWFFEKSKLCNTLKVSTSAEFLSHYFEIVNAMLKENK